MKEKAPRYQLVSFTVEAKTADAAGGEPIFALDGKAIGAVSSGAYGHTVGASLAMGSIECEYAVPGAEFEIAVLGQPHRAILLAEPLFDPAGVRLRS